MRLLLCWCSLLDTVSASFIWQCSESSGWMRLCGTFNAMYHAKPCGASDA